MSISRTRSAFVCFVALVGISIFSCCLPAAEKPNIVYFLADDLGWSDVSFHGGDIKTPNLDKLAAAGARLESFYVQPVCSPTRAAFMTGRYPMRYGLQVGVVRPWANYGLPLEERTLPQALKSVGYTTAICGKWHLGHFQPEYFPTRRGFDHQYGHYNGALDYFTHLRDGGFDWHRDDQVCRDEGYSTVLIGDEAVRLVENHDTKQPLFLYVPFNAPHGPLQALPEHLELYSHIPEKTRRTYAAMVHAMDEQVGRIVASFEARGMSDNTLFIFSSDNGGPLRQGATNGSLRAGKGTVYEGGTRVAAFATWKNRIPAGSVVNTPLHVVDWYPTLLKLTGASLEQKLPLDGRDAWAAIAQNGPSPHDAILLNTTPRNGAVRVGDWKLVWNGDTSDGDLAENLPKKKKDKSRNADGEVGRTGRVELFNVVADPSEKNNLAMKEPEKVRELQAKLAAFAAEAVPPRSAPKASDFRTPKVWGEPLK